MPLRDHPAPHTFVSILLRVTEVFVYGTMRTESVPLIGMGVPSIVWPFSRFGDINAQLAQLADDPWGAPGRIGLPHCAAQIPDVLRNRRTARRATRSRYRAERTPGLLASQTTDETATPRADDRLDGGVRDGLCIDTRRADAATQHVPGTAMRVTGTARP